MSTNNLSHGNLFKVATYDEEYWATYLAARPKYSPDFYNIIYEYHSRNENTSFELAHDIGTGPGQVAATLAERFNHVIASDSNATHLAIAQHRLSDLKRVTFIEASGENIALKCPTTSADLVTAAECMPLMVLDVAVACFASLLRPGGTLAIWFYGRPTFAEESFGPSCQAIYDKIASKAFSKVINSTWQQGTTTMVSWLDNVALPEEEWTHVKRYKWNTDATMAFFDESAYDFEVQRTSCIRPDEDVTELRDRGFWGEKWRTAEVRRFLNVNMPGFKESGADTDEEIEGWYKDLEEAMGGAGAAREITWPVVLILATKK